VTYPCSVQSNGLDPRCVRITGQRDLFNEAGCHTAGEDDHLPNVSLEGDQKHHVQRHVSGQVGYADAIDHNVCKPDHKQSEYVIVFYFKIVK